MLVSICKQITGKSINKDSENYADDYNFHVQINLFPDLIDSGEILLTRTKKWLLNNKFIRHKKLKKLIIEYYFAFKPVII